MCAPRWDLAPFLSSLCFFFFPWYVLSNPVVFQSSSIVIQYYCIPVKQVPISRNAVAARRQVYISVFIPVSVPLLMPYYASLLSLMSFSGRQSPWVCPVSLAFSVSRRRIYLFLALSVKLGTRAPSYRWDSAPLSWSSVLAFLPLRVPRQLCVNHLHCQSNFTFHPPS